MLLPKETSLNLLLLLDRWLHWRSWSGMASMRKPTRVVMAKVSRTNVTSRRHRGELSLPTWSSSTPASTRLTPRVPVAWVIAAIGIKWATYRSFSVISLRILASYCYVFWRHAASDTVIPCIYDSNSRHKLGQPNDQGAIRPNYGANRVIQASNRVSHPQTE